MPDDDARAEQRERRATDLAFAQGKRQAEIDGRLNSHDEQLRALNGSIEKNARNTAALGDSVEAMGEKLDGIVSTLATREAVEQERVKQLRTANEKQISNRTFWLGVGAVVIPLIVLIVSILNQAH